MRAASQALARPGKVADAPALAAIEQRVSPSPWSEQQFFSACAGEHSRERVLVVDNSRQIQGFVIYSEVLDEASIHNIAVDPGSQGNGLGELLLSTVLARLRDCGTHRCLLEMRVSNEAAHGLYRKLGFQADGLRKDYYPTASGREDAVLMSLVLREQE